MKKLLAILLSLVLVLSFAACSGGSTETTTAEGESTVDTGDEAAQAKVKLIDIELTDEEYAFGVDKDQPELLEQVNEFIEKIMQDGTFDAICDKYFGDGEPTAVTSAVEDSSKDQLVVATNAAFAPFEYKEGDSYYGIDMEIAALLAEELDKELVIADMNFDSVCLSVGEHRCDIAMAGLTVNEEREELVTFSESYYEASQKLIVPADETAFDECKTADDVTAILNAAEQGQKIGFQSGTTGQYYVLGDEEWEFDGFKNFEGKGYENGSLAVQDLLNGNIAYVIIDAAPAARIVESVNSL